MDFWSDKLNGNKARDVRNRDALIQAGWQVLVIWECELDDLMMLKDRLRIFLGPSGSEAKTALGAWSDLLPPPVAY